jgi:hypothetical protein
VLIGQTRDNGLMSLLRFTYLIFAAATALAAFTAAIYWYLSGRPTPETTVPPTASISDNPAAYILGAQVNIFMIHQTLYEASRLNKKAAIWSAIAAFLGALTSILGIV